MFFKLSFGVFVTFLFDKIRHKHTFFFGTFTTELVDSMSIISKTKKIVGS